MVNESKIVELLKNKTLTQAQIANQCGVSSSYVSKLNNKYGIRSPKEERTAVSRLPISTPKKKPIPQRQRRAMAFDISNIIKKPLPKYD